VSRRVRAVFFVAAWAIGVGLRLSFPADIEYKGDEAWTFHTVQNGVWPAIGMDSSAGSPTRA